MSVVQGRAGRFWTSASCLCLLVLGACGGSVSAPESTITTETTTGSAQAGLQLGVFSGGSSPQNAAGFEAWLGRTSDFNVDFFAYQTYTGSNTLASSAGWDAHVWSLANRPDRNMLFSVPLATYQDSSLMNVANGLYDAQFLQTAQAVAAYYPKAIIRLGWEFNGQGFPWSAAGRAQDYIDAFRHVVQIFRSVSSAFRIDWCPNLGSNSMDAELAYPGDDVVDAIGMDVYDDWNYSTQVTDPAVRWNYIVNEDHGLNWQKQFAAVHGKPLSFPEWGVNHDDPYFIQQMYAWITGNNVAYAAYWSSDSGFAGNLDEDQYPNVSSAYKTLFGAIPRVQ